MPFSFNVKIHNVIHTITKQKVYTIQACGKTLILKPTILIIVHVPVFGFKHLDATAGLSIEAGH